MAHHFLVFLSLALLISSLSIQYVLGAAPLDDPVSTCITVAIKLDPCLQYIIKGDGPTEACCTGVSDVSKLGQSKRDRVVICLCLQKMIINLDSKDIPPRVAELPNKCGVSYNMPPIDKNYNCNNMPMTDDEGVLVIKLPEPVTEPEI
ncbi:hypothetical protein FXO38_10278 [Capsicum annuum]|uniref:Non-specific lipid-transfer protein n=1 Tax=Capsicum annuum TaxID=4072 RepID=A0A1U8HNR9_CAPAN|nr:non-specific lipid-transfer protein isoform X1 [Capsicum annuum]KAF3654154.1 hypothetical protein FXO37_16639 [Capsicum annuum]KAF3664154.1 hypothetical protein FXO38_10278 [Capsicum annuum]PHT74705.1 hypothetical protein T459_21982 [Capsicum annuum]